MTACVLVEHPIPTSEAMKHVVGWIEARKEVALHQRTVTTAGPVWVVLEGVPCPECGGMGSTATQLADGSDVAPYGCCPTCGGLGLVAPSWDGPTLLAEWGEYRLITNSGLAATDWRWGYRPPKPNEERRQVISWRAHDKLLLPVVDGDGAGADDNRYPLVEISHALDERRVVLFDGPCPDDLPVQEWGTDVASEPWAASLRPGQWVVRFDRLEAVTPAITEIRCTCAEHGPVGGGMVVNTHTCPAWRTNSRVPLDLKPGLNHIEVAA